MKIVHFADAHIDAVTIGKLDPKTGLPVRVMDFLKSLDTIVETAIDEKVDMVLFAGDAFKGRTPAPTYQREWGRRIMRLANEGILTLLLTGNHDVSPAFGRAHALEAFDTLEVSKVRVIDRPCLLGPDELEGNQVQVIAIPWISRSGMMGMLQLEETDPRKIYDELEQRVTEMILSWIDGADKNIPLILMAHAAVRGEKLSSERAITFEREIVLPASLVKDERLDYVALGHIHMGQDINEGSHPPVVNPGSIERIDWGEVNDEKYFVITNIRKGKTKVKWMKLDTRPFIDVRVKVENQKSAMETILNALPTGKEMKNALVRLTVELPSEWQRLIDTAAVTRKADSALSFQINIQPIVTPRMRLPDDRSMESLTPLEILDIYWDAKGVKESDLEKMKPLAAEIIASDLGERLSS